MGQGMSKQSPQDEINTVMNGKGKVVFSVAAVVLALAFIVYGFIL